MLGPKLAEALCRLDLGRDQVAANVRSFNAQVYGLRSKLG